MGWSEKYINACHETQKGNYVRYQEFNLNGIYNVNDTFDTSLALDKYDNIKLSTNNCHLNDDGVLFPFESESDIETVTMYVSQCFLSPGYGNGNSITQWGYHGNSKYQITGVGLWFGSLPVNEYCTFLDGFKIRDLRTNTTRALTLDDLLNPSDNYTITYTTDQAFRTYVKDGSNLNGDAITTIPCLTFVNDNIFASSLANNFTYRMSNTWNISTMSSVSSSETQAMAIKNLNDSRKMIFNVNGSEHSGNIVFKNDYGVFISTLAGNLQTLVFEPTLKFFVNILQSTGGYYTLETMSGTWNDERFKNDANILLGELDNTGKPTRKWLTALERQNSTSPNLSTSWENKTNTYDADKDIPDRNYFDNIGLNANYGTSKFVTWYSMTGDQLNGLKDFINNESRPIGFDPMKNIISVSEFPFDIDTICSTAGTSMIRIGKETYGSFGGDTIAKIILTQERIIDLGEYTFNRSYNNYLDYAPYTDIKVYLPYCNDLITLNPDIVMGETIHCYLIADIITGSVRGVVTCNTCTIAENSGTFGNTVPLSAENVGAYKSAMLNSIGGIASGVLSTAVGGATGNPIAIASGAMSVIGSITQLSAVDNTSYVDVKGSSSPCTMYNRSATPYVIITQTRPKRPDNYAHTIGYPCYKTLTINDLNGYFVAENTDIEINATETEKSMIKNILESGCYK